MKKQLIKKGALGLDAGIGLGLSAISGINSIIQQNKLKKEQRRAMMEAQKNNFDNAVIEQDVYNTQFKEENINDLPVYKKGGNIQNTMKSSTMGNFDTTGGDLMPISQDAEIVVGNKHSENKVDGSYGVTLSKDGQPIANVEDEEVIVNDRLVFSNKLKKGNETFADIALKVNKRIGSLEKDLEVAKNPSEKFSIERTIQGLQNKNENLFKEQELVKQNTVGDTEDYVEVNNGIVAKGEDGLDLYGSLLPLAADNITNAILTNNAPKIAKPIKRRAPILDTTINVNPALAEIKNSINAGNKVISDNTNNSVVNRANITNNNLKGLQASSNILATKEAQEIQLKNNQNKILADNANVNAGLQDDYNADVYQQSLEKNASTSANITNAVDDFKYVQTGINMDRQSQFELEMDMLRDPTLQKARDAGKVKQLAKKYKQRLFNDNTK